MKKCPECKKKHEKLIYGAFPLKKKFCSVACSAKCLDRWEKKMLKRAEQGKSHKHQWISGGYGWPDSGIEDWVTCGFCGKRKFT